MDTTITIVITILKIMNDECRMMRRMIIMAMLITMTTTNPP